MSKGNEVDHQVMQHLLTEGSVDWAGFSDAIARDTDALLGGPASVLLIDESDFSKKGEASAGVARQWNGRLGKVDHCQVGVFATLCRGQLASLIDSRLYLPKAWAENAARCRKAAQRFRSKTELALEMLEAARARGVRFGDVGVDGGYGKQPAFLRAVDRLGCCFVADVHSDQPIYQQDPTPMVPAGSGRGPRPVHRKAQTPTQRVDDWTAAQPLEAWQRLTLSEGEKGKLVAEYLHTHVFVWDGTEAGARCWHLFVRREVDASKISHYGLSNAPTDTPLAKLARVPAQGFFIEHRVREAKSECGLADYQVRRWDAWHHHMALGIVGTLFLVKQKSKAGRRGRCCPSTTGLPHWRTGALAHLLPRRQMTAEDLADIIAKRHRLRRDAKESHTRRSMAALE